MSIESTVRELRERADDLRGRGLDSQPDELADHLSAMADELEEYVAGQDHAAE